MTDKFSTMYGVTAVTEIRLCDIDSSLGIQNFIGENGVEKGMEILSCLRQEAKKSGSALGRFVVKRVFLLNDDGKVYRILPETFEDAKHPSRDNTLDVMSAKDFRTACGITCLHTTQYL